MNPPANARHAGDAGSIPRKSPGGGNGNHSSALAWKIPWTEEPERATVHGVAKSQTRLSDHTTTSFLERLYYTAATYLHTRLMSEDQAIINSMCARNRVIVLSLVLQTPGA